jgi:hypothetical protein
METAFILSARSSLLPTAQSLSQQNILCEIKNSKYLHFFFSCEWPVVGEREFNTYHMVVRNNEQMQGVELIEKSEKTLLSMIGHEYD